MTMKLLVLLLLSLQCLLSSSQNQNGNYKRFCYVTSWSRYRDDPVSFSPEDIGANLCTHLCWAFAELDDTGRHIKVHDKSDLAMFKRFNAVKKTNPNVKTLLSIGGWNMGSKTFSRLVSSETNINTFAVSAARFLRAQGFDGLDLDWEYPGMRGSPAGDRERYTKLVQILHLAFAKDGLIAKKEPLLLTAALNPQQEISSHSYQPTELAKYLDLINLETYDLHNGNIENVTGHHAPLYGSPIDPSNNVDSLASYWAGLGIPKEKILIGLPFYGNSFALNNHSVNGLGAASHGPGNEGKFTHETGVLAYFEICDLLMNGGAENHVSKQSVPYMVDNNRWVGYDNEKSLQEKVQYVMDHGFGGVMIWAIDLDDFSGMCGKKYPLLNAVNNAFSSIVG